MKSVKTLKYFSQIKVSMSMFFQEVMVKVSIIIESNNGLFRIIDIIGAGEDQEAPFMV